MIIYSHRGLDFERKDPLPENSLLSFSKAAEQGFGIELDLQLSRDGELLVAHDPTLDRFSKGADLRRWDQLSAIDLSAIEPRFGPVCRFAQVFHLLEKFPSLHAAVHIKSENQTAKFLERLISTLRENLRLHTRLLLFDLKPPAATQLRTAFHDLALAASVAHPHDIARFQSVTQGTLFTADDIIARKSSYNWMWLDEWDRKSAPGVTKNLYSREFLESAHKQGFKVALISPELHRSDGHEDGQGLAQLDRRWREILAGVPDAICTDYPTRLLGLSKAG